MHPLGTPATLTRCKKRISGPWLDRIDTLRDIEVPRVACEKLTDSRLGEPSRKVRARVETAHEKQRLRFTSPGLSCNADTRSDPADVRNFYMLDDAGTALMRTAMGQLQLSARGFHPVFKLARTIADLVDSEAIQPAQLAEALHLRPAEATELKYLPIMPALARRE